ncbi:hypothetical protein L7F22_053125 [Adiantum nelumboides]|nr:hypothetical protein [Adiantum nelumboides]
MIFVKDSLSDVNKTQVNESGMHEDLELSKFLNQFQDVFIDDIPGELPPKRGDDDHAIELIPDYVAIIEKENERSKQECARLSRIVESGEWARQQFAEILEAKDVLSVEREALAALISRLNQQQTAVLEQREKNDNEMQHFKDKLFGSNFINHNKLLIKGASSFNTVVRALKTDALKRGVHPEFLCAVDRLAMDKVSVFPDGEIRVKTFCNFEKGKWMPKVTSSSIPDLSASCHASNLLNKRLSFETTSTKV